MIEIIGGNIFSSKCQTLVNPVNCVGVSGAGLAKEIRLRWPHFHSTYKNLCDEGLLVPGKFYLYRSTPKYILAFPTKRHYRDRSRLEDIEAGLQRFSEEYANLDITSVAFPALGCGLGGLDYTHQVRPLMIKYLAHLPITCEVYTPK